MNAMASEIAVTRNVGESIVVPQRVASFAARQKAQQTLLHPGLRRRKMPARTCSD